MWQLCMIQKWRLHPFMSLFSMKRLRVWASKVPQAACETFLKRVSNVGPLLAELLRSSYQVIRRPAVFLVKVGRKCSQSSWFLLKLQLCIATWNMASLQVYLNEKIFWYLTMTSSDYALFLAPFCSINFKVHWWSFGREMKIEVMLFQRLMEVLNSCKFLSDLPLGRLLVKLVSTSSNMFATWIWGIYFPQNLKKFALCIMSHWASILQIGRVLTDSTGVSMATHLLDWMLMTYSSTSRWVIYCHSFWRKFMTFCFIFRSSMVCFIIAIWKSVVWLLCSQSAKFLPVYHSSAEQFPPSVIIERELISQLASPKYDWLSFLKNAADNCWINYRIAEFTRKTTGQDHQSSSAQCVAYIPMNWLNFSIIFWLLFAYFFMNEHRSSSSAHFFLTLKKVTQNIIVVVRRTQGVPQRNSSKCHIN